MGIRLEINIPEHHYNNIMAIDSVSIGRVPYKGIIMYAINAIKHGKVLEQEPTTKSGTLVSLGVYRQVAWERDIAIEQLHELGYEFGEKIESRWIPVSERLPEAFSYVNCTCHSLIDDREDWVVETVYLPQPLHSPYSDWGNIPMLNSCECEVIAWMYRDIPKPYKAESEVEDGNDNSRKT